MQCQEIMKRNLHAVGAIDDVLVAARKMRDHVVGFLPVCDEAGRLVGVVTDRDLAVRVCAEDARAATTAVGAVMTPGATTCKATHTVGHAERLMRHHHFTRVVVVDDERRPVGVLSLSDIAQYVRPSRLGLTVQAVTERKYAPERP